MPEDSTGDEEDLVAYAINDTLHEMIEAAKTKGRMQHVTLIQAPATDAMCGRCHYDMYQTLYRALCR